MYTNQRLPSTQFVIQRYLELLRVLVERNLSARYRGSMLGILWSLLNPMATTAVYTMIFGAAFKDYYGSILNYILAVFTGLVLIQFFTISTTQAMGSIVGNGGLFNKVKLPMSIFPISVVAANAFQFFVAVFPILAVITLVTSKSLIHVLMLFIPIISLILISIGGSFLVSTLYVFFRDLPYFYEVFCFLIFLCTPIFYPAQIVAGRVSFFLDLNPFVPIIEAVRQIALSQTLPNIEDMLIPMLTGLFFLALGWLWF
ncbi:MAG: ABC transporter permease, partial [Cyanobacteria bacterium]|nr:ABC transporter permease [Cyanobacteriota bacterium]MDW8202333.1 ABC transporter permease [Cyanobacteriota bacterium SKYGB_h_bin112]